jgi:nucleoside-diphosphate-sugar epimerase
VSRTVLITGGSGYFGSLLAGHLQAAGDTVRNFDIATPDQSSSGIDFIKGDVLDRRALREACEGADVIFHNVAQVPLAREKHLLERVNIDGTANLLDVAREAGVRKVVHTSSSAVFGIPASNPVREDTKPRPVELYGRAKLRAEELCRDAVSRGLDVTVIRPRTILGHGRLGIVSILFDWVADGAPAFVLGRGDNRYQFVHALDLAEACKLASERPGPSVYNIGATTFGTMRETLQALVEHAATGSTVRSLPVGPTVAAMKLLTRFNLAPFAPYHWLLYGESLWFDVSKAREELGWESRYSNADMIIESYDWFLQHRQDLSERGGSLHRSLVRQGLLKSLKRVARAGSRRRR